MRATLAATAVDDWELLLHIEIERRDLHRNCLRITEHSPTWFGLLKKTIYELVHSGLCWFRRFKNSIKAKNFAQSHANPCMFGRLVGEVVNVVVVYVDDILLASKARDGRERAIICALFMP